MANYVANARTNKFRIKDMDALVEDLGKVGLSAVIYEPGKPSSYGDLEIVRVDTAEDGSESIKIFANEGWPPFDEESIAYRLELEDDEIVPESYESLHMLVSRHLVDGEVAIFVEVGAEKLRYLGGVAVAVNTAGETRRIDLDDIVDLAKEIAPEGAKIDHPSY